MDFGIANVSIIPLRKMPEEQSEMLTQILFGETFRITETTEKWIRVTTAYDRCEGWIDRKMYLPAGENMYQKIEKQVYPVSSKNLNLYPENKKGYPLYIPKGSTLPFFNPEKQTLKIGNDRLVLRGNLSGMIKKPSRSSVTGCAMSYMNAPYLWGGRTPFGIDCSGFTQIVYKIHGIKIPRNSYEQAKEGNSVNLNESLPGDLAFFQNEQGKIIHVGMILTQKQIIHASGKVRIDQLDRKGIINSDSGKYTHRLKLIRKYFY